MDRIRIKGGVPLEGVIAIGGAKNAALPLMTASLLTPETLTLENVPDLADVATMSNLLVQHGAAISMGEASSAGGHRVELSAAHITSITAPYDLVRKMRASVLVLGPLVARCGRARVSLPGGCAIGTRPIDLHISGLRQLGAEVTEVSPYRWERPEDEEPVVRLIEDLAAGWIDVLAATSAAQVDHLFAIAQQRGHEETLRQALGRPELHVAAQGIVCASAFERRGVEVDLIPRHASMGALVVEIANTPGNCPISSSATAPGDGTVAVVAGRDVERDCIARALAGFGPRTTVAVVAGRSPLVQQVAIEHGLAVQCFPSDRTDAMIQRATSVLVLNGARRNLQAGRVLKLAGRYAKPVQIIEPPHTP